MNAATPQPAAPVVIALPTGLPLSGITTWAVRLASLLHERCARRVALIVHDHDEAEGQPTELGIANGVDIVRLTGATSIHSCGGDYSSYLPLYRRTIERLAGETGSPVVAIPTLAGDCWGVFASLAVSNPDLLRLVSWTHNDIAYDYALAAHFEPVVAAYAGISRHICDRLAPRLPRRESEIRYVPSVVPFAAAFPMREPPGSRPLRLMYTGRLEHEQKRVLALIEMSDNLASRQAPHELTIVGDGPAREEVRALVAGRGGRIRLICGDGAGGPPGMAALTPLLARADIFVLPSRYEGACISMLEAMGQGAVPVVPQDVAAALEAIEPGVGGEVALTWRNDDARTAGGALADAVCRLGRSDLAARGEICRRLIAERHSENVHLRAALEVIERAAGATARWWPASRPCAPAGRSEETCSQGSMTAPASAPARAARALLALAGRRIALWGAGRHTIALAPALARSGADIGAVIDDNPRSWNQRLWGYPICGPDDVAALGITDVLISSWLHEEAMWARRDVLESQGIRVHRLYADESDCVIDAA